MSPADCLLAGRLNRIQYMHGFVDSAGGVSRSPRTMRRLNHVTLEDVCFLVSLAFSPSLRPGPVRGQSEGNDGAYCIWLAYLACRRRRSANQLVGHISMRVGRCVWLCMPSKHPAMPMMLLIATNSGMRTYLQTSPSQ